MTTASEARVPTKHASRYVQQLCKHWSHNLSVELDETRGTIVFPRDSRGAEWPADATVTLSAETAALVCRIDASHPGQLEGLQGALAQHLDRFAFREAPMMFDWHDA